MLGGVFVVLVILLLLGNVRAALLVTLTIPLSIALAGLLLKPLGVGLNTMTLGGLAIAVGLLVDAAIIMIENILHRLSGATTRRERRERALHAAIEVARPIAFATFIVIVVFLPLFGISGIEGRMYQPLAAAVIAAMAAALILALTLVPIAAASILRPSRTRTDDDVALLRKVKQWYAPVLDRCLRHPVLVAIATLMIVIPSAALGLRIGSDFMPQLDEGAFLLQTVLPAEAALDEVDRLNHRVEDVLRQIPEVEDVVRRTGRAERTEDPMPHTLSDVLVVLKADRSRELEEIEADMRRQLDGMPGIAVLFTTPLGMRIDEGLGGTPADLSVRIFGPDLDDLSRIAEQAEDLIRDVRGIADLRAEQLTGLPQLQIAVNREATSRVGLAPGDVIRAIRVGLVGEEESQIWVGQRRFDLVVRLRDDRRDTLDAIRALLIDGHDGRKIPLGQLAEVTQTFGPAAIRREAGTRRIAVEASVNGRDLGSTAEEVRQILSDRLRLPAGYFFDLGGRVESQARASRALALAIGAALFGVFVLLLIALGSAVEAAMILATVPIAFVGGILALLIAGETWNVSSLVGLIGLFGIAVQNSLVLVTQTRGLAAEGRTPVDAVREASIGRVRPKLMTAGTATLGLLPLLVLQLHGTEIERPLAVVMMGGLATSTIFTLLVLPTFYLQVHGWLERRAASTD
jgi:cobalt-zinc-cadmium resistance protein CzcA